MQPRENFSLKYYLFYQSKLNCIPLAKKILSESLVPVNVVLLEKSGLHRNNQVKMKSPQ